MSGVLEGIRVLDFGRYIAGPFCGTMLADLGAEVIRVEKLEGSEDRWVTPVVEGGEGAMFLQMGRNKLGLTLNPMKPEGREIVKKLVAASDIVIANLPYEDLQKMGIDYETISAIKTKYNGNIYSVKTGDNKSRETLSGIWIRIYSGTDLVYESATPEKLTTTEKW